jgi:hypothetical protein
MTSMKRFALAALFTLALISGTARAQFAPIPVSGSTRLQPSEFSDEPAAKGAATFEGTLTWFWSWDGYLFASFGGTLDVSCRGLTPFATYRIDGSPYFTADSSGRATVTVSDFSAVGGLSPRPNHAVFGVIIWRQVTESDGTVTYVEVLEGGFDVKLP